MNFRATTAELWRDGRGWILAAVAVGWLLQLGMRLTFPALLPYFRSTFGIGLTTAGALLTLLWISYALAQVPGGILGDKIGERNILVGSTAIATAGLVLVTVSVTRWWFYAATILLGIGTGLYATTRVTVLSDVYPERSGTAIGVCSGAGNVGTMTLPAVGGFIAAGVGWRLGFGFALPLYLAILVGLWLVVPNRTSASAGDSDDTSVGILRRVLADMSQRSVLCAMGAMLCMSFLYQSFTGFYPTYLLDGKGLDGGAVAILFGLFFGLGIVIQPAAGAVSDRIGSKPTVGGLVVLTALGLVALPMASRALHFRLLTLLLSMQLGFWPVAFTSVIESLSETVQGSGFGIIRASYLVLAASGPVAVGALADAGFFDESFVLLGGVAAVAGALYALS